MVGWGRGKGGGNDKKGKRGHSGRFPELALETPTWETGRRTVSWRRPWPSAARLSSCPGNHMGSLSRGAYGEQIPGPHPPNSFLSSLRGSTKWSADGNFRNCDVVGFSSHFLHPQISGGQRLGQGKWGVTAREHRGFFLGCWERCGISSGGCATLSIHQNH